MFVANPSETEDVKTDLVTVVIWDKDPIGKDFLGMASVPVCLADHRKDALDVWVPLKSRLELSESKKTMRGKPILNASGGRGEVRVVITLGEAPKARMFFLFSFSFLYKHPLFLKARPSLEVTPSSRNVTTAERDSLTKTVLNNFSMLAHSHTESSTWQIPTEGFPQK